MEPVHRPGATGIGQGLEIEFEFGDRRRIEQFADLLGTKQFGEQVAVEGERLGPALGEWRVALVQEGTDVVEQERGRERRRTAGLHLDDDLAQRMPPRTSRRAGRSKTSDRHSRTVSSTIGNEPYRLATARRSAERWRCIHSGVRCPGRRRGRSSARAAFSRKRAANSDEEPSWASTSSSMASGSRGPGVERGVVCLGQAERDPVVGPQRIDLEATLGEPRFDGHRPRRVDPAAERGQQADPPVAQLVAEALDDDRPIRRQRSGRLALLRQVGGQVAGCPLVEVAPVGLEPPSDPGSVDSASRTKRPIARPSSMGRPTPSPFQKASSPVDRAPG